VVASRVHRWYCTVRDRDVARQNRRRAFRGAAVFGCCRSIPPGPSGFIPPTVFWLGGVDVPACPVVHEGLEKVLLHASSDRYRSTLRSGAPVHGDHQAAPCPGCRGANDRDRCWRGGGGGGQLVTESRQRPQQPKRKQGPRDCPGAIASGVDKSTPKFYFLNHEAALVRTRADLEVTNESNSGALDQGWCAHFCRSAGPRRM
jgi:hypothetical protein